MTLTKRTPHDRWKRTFHTESLLLSKTAKTHSSIFTIDHWQAPHVTASSGLDSAASRFRSPGLPPLPDPGYGGVRLMGA